MKFKKIERRLLLLGGGAILGLAVLGCLFSYLLSTPLKIYPNTWRAHIALNILAASVYKEPICHENCYWYRQTYYQLVAAALRHSVISDRIKNIILNEDENLTWRLELIEFLGANSENQPPEYLVEYLNDPLGKIEIQTAINQNFSLPTNAWQTYLQTQISSPEVAVADKVVALKSLLGLEADGLVDFYLGLLTSDLDGEIKRLAITGLSNLRQPEVIYTTENLSLFKVWLLDQKTDIHFKQALVFLLADYLKINQPAAIEILQLVYKDEQVDKFTKSLVVDILEPFGVGNLKKPVISELEWSDYYAL